MMTHIFRTGNLFLIVSVAASAFLLQGTRSAFAQTIPKGAVMAFRLADCPSGWRPAADLAGRAVIGAGDGQKDQNGKPLTKRAIGDAGGEETHTLSLDEMPSHSHAAQGYNGTDRAANQGGPGDVLFSATNTRTGTEGKGQPHNSMPPYLVLRYCEKN
jgi:microcystin-dependent protein